MKFVMKPYLRKASIIAAATILFGLLLSFVVYYSSDKVRSNAIDLMDNRIPVLISIKELMADLGEQERIIYEYYSDQDSEVFLDKSAKIAQAFAMHLQAIESQSLFSEQALVINQKQEQIKRLFNDFHQLMLISEDNWDEMREVLSEISSVRRELLPTLLEIEQYTQQVAERGHQSTLAQIQSTHWLVITFGGLLVIVAALVSWYIRQYIITQAKITRLAMFTQANPNPILSVNNVGKIVFSNPACQRLLAYVGYHENEIEKLLPENFMALRQEITKTDLHSLSLEQSLNDRILQISMHWHQTLDAYDIHIHDITERKLAEREVNQLAFYNPETLLPNQYKFKEDVDLYIAKNQSIAVGIIDIRHFNKKVGSLGIEATFALTRAVSKVIARSIPASVKLFHLNQGQFAVICQESLDSLSLQRLTQIISKEALKPLATQYGEFFVEFDFGYACYPKHGKNRNQVVQNAHIALAHSTKEAHENFTLYKDQYGQAIEKDNLLVDKLRNAIALDELFLVFQPQVSLHSNRILGIETLVRWKHQDQIIPPVDFIPLAESSGLIVSIGEWILNQACLMAKQLVENGYRDLVVAVNVSPRQFSHPQFCQTVLKALETSQLPAKNLELEITEGVFMHNEQNTISLLSTLKSHGVQLSIDDFGTGYSSLSYLKRFPIDKLKIDQSFIRDSHTNEEDKAIVNTIVGLGKNLGLTLIAEGVEELTHVEFLKSIQCDEIQGYWFSRPLAQDKLLAFLNQHKKHDVIEQENVS